MKKIIPVVILLLVACVCIMPLAGCGGKSELTSDSAAIEDAMRGQVAAFNAKDYEKCLDYMAGWEESDKESSLEGLQMMREHGGIMTIETIENIVVTGSTATANVTISIMGESNTDEMNFIKEDGVWKVMPE